MKLETIQARSQFDQRNFVRFCEFFVGQFIGLCFCDLTAFFVPVDLRELTLTEGVEYGQTWI
jgi:hypothetical protein